MIVEAMKELTAALKVLGHLERLRILALLSHGELTASELVLILSLSQPRVTQYIKSLEDAGIVERVKEGSWVFSRLKNSNANTSTLVATILSLLPEDNAILLSDARRLEGVRAKRAEIADTFFARVANDRGQLGDDFLPRESVEKAMSELVGKGPFDYMVDMGTGTGRVLSIFSDYVKAGIGIDNNVDMLKVARHNLTGAQNAHITVRHGDLNATALSRGVSDFVTLHQVLHYMDHPAQAISEAARILAVTGLLLIVDFTPHTHEDFREKYAHRKLGFSDADISNWLTINGLTLVKSSLVTTKGERPDVRLWLGTKLQTRRVSI